jgi:hypothetical protein
MRRRLVVLLASVVCAGAATAGAFAAPSAGTGGVTTLTTQDPTTYQLTSDARGAGTVLWTTEKFVGPENQADAVIHVRQQNSRGSWSAPVQVGGVTETNDAQLVESSSGAAAVVWYYVEGGPHSRTVLLVATRRTPDGSWSAPKTVWSADNAGGLVMTVGIDASGNVTVAWASYGATNPAIWVDTVNTPDDAINRPEQVVAAGAGGTAPDLAENATGAAVLSWQRQLSTTRREPIGSSQRFAEMAAQRPTDSADWSAAQQLGTFSIPEEPGGSEFWGPVAPTSVVMANGTAAVGWRAGGGESGVPLEISTRIPASTSWSVPHELTRNLGGFSVVAGANNELVAVWSTDTAKELALTTATSADAAHWSTPSQLARVRGGTYGPILTAAANGRIALAPLTGNGTPIQYATRSPAGRWSTLNRVGTGDNAEVAVTASGSVTVLWETFNQHNQYRLETRTQR